MQKKELYTHTHKYTKTKTKIKIKNKTMTVSEEEEEDMYEDNREKPHGTSDMFGYRQTSQDAENEARNHKNNKLNNDSDSEEMFSNPEQTDGNEPKTSYIIYKIYFFLYFMSFVVYKRYKPSFFVCNFFCMCGCMIDTSGEA